MGLMNIIVVGNYFLMFGTSIKETWSVTMNIFEKRNLFLFKSFVN